MRSLLEKAASTPGPLRRVGACVALAVPLQARGVLVGALTLYRSRESRGFEQIDIEFALDLARRASVAIDNAQLYAEAQRSLRLREDVLAIVSHDLRNPLGAIAMSVQHLLEHVGPDEERARGLGVILRSTRHLIEELLDVANIQKGNLVLQRADVQLDACVNESLVLFEANARHKRVQLRHESRGSRGTIHCDAERMIRAIANLVGNAVKFTRAGGEVKVTTERTIDAVRIAIRDTGPGIWLQDRSELFEQYWKGRGTGRGWASGFTSRTASCRRTAARSP